MCLAFLSAVVRMPSKNYVLDQEMWEKDDKPAGEDAEFKMKSRVVHGTSM